MNDKQQVTCHFCGWDQGTFLYTTYSLVGDPFHLVRCENCCCVFLFPQPTPQVLAEAYATDYYGEGEEKFSGWIETVLDRFRKRRARLVVSHVEVGGKVLDIGCGNGNFLRYVAAEGRKAFGLELPGNSLERARRIPELSLKEGRLQRGDYPGDSFDMITLWHVFEHLDRPRETLEIIDEILKPGGFLVLSLPNIESCQSTLFRAHWFHLDPPRHLFFLGPKELASELKKMGLMLHQRSFFSLEQNPFGMQQSLLNWLLPDRDVLFEALKGRPGGGRHYSKLNLALQKLFYLSSFPLFTAFSALEAAFGRGGTMELIFQKRN